MDSFRLHSAFEYKLKYRLSCIRSQNVFLCARVHKNCEVQLAALIKYRIEECIPGQLAQSVLAGNWVSGAGAHTRRGGGQLAICIAPIDIRKECVLTN